MGQHEVADVAEVVGDAVGEGSGLAGEQVGEELFELGLLKPTVDPGQGAVGGDPVVVEGHDHPSPPRLSSGVIHANAAFVPRNIREGPAQLHEAGVGGEREAPVPRSGQRSHA